ncbi:unnamed protein product [Gadus morhua 'NCC']
MYQQLQKKDIDAVFFKRALQSFTSSVQAIRDQSSSPEQQQVAAGTTGKRRALGEQDKQRLSKEEPQQESDPGVQIPLSSPRQSVNVPLRSERRARSPGDAEGPVGTLMDVRTQEGPLVL